VGTVGVDTAVGGTVAGLSDGIQSSKKGRKRKQQCLEHEVVGAQILNLGAGGPKGI
jgi:hypothetical protein